MAGVTLIRSLYLWMQAHLANFDRGPNLQRLEESQGPFLELTKGGCILRYRNLFSVTPAILIGKGQVCPTSSGTLCFIIAKTKISFINHTVLELHDVKLLSGVCMHYNIQRMHGRICFIE